jgi:hypothetical protein
LSERPHKVVEASAQSYRDLLPDRAAKTLYGLLGELPIQKRRQNKEILKELMLVLIILIESINLYAL